MGGSKHQRKWWMSLSDAMKVIFCLHEIHRETGWKATPRILDELGLLSLINYLLITLDSYECWRVCFQPLLKSQWYRTLKCLSFNWAVPIVMSKWAACICMMIFHTKWWANEQQAEGWAPTSSRNSVLKPFGTHNDDLANQTGILEVRSETSWSWTFSKCMEVFHVTQPRPFLALRFSAGSGMLYFIENNDNAFAEKKKTTRSSGAAVSLGYCWWFRNPANQLIWLKKSHYLQGFYTSKRGVGLGISEASTGSPDITRWRWPSKTPHFQLFYQREDVGTLGRVTYQLFPGYSFILPYISHIYILGTWSYTWLGYSPKGTHLFPLILVMGLLVKK